MPPKKGSMRPQITNIEQLRTNISGGGATARAEALQDLISFFNKPSLKHGILKNKEYHGLCEALFSAVVADKKLAISGKSGRKTALVRLNDCGKALKDTVANGVSKLKGNTVRAVIDHIMDTLPDRDGDFFQPLAHGYIQTLVVIFGHPVHAESLALLDGDAWMVCVDFVIARISRLLEDADDFHRGLGSVGRDSPAPGTARQPSIALSNGRSRTSSQRATGQPQQQELSSLVQGLLSLVSASNAPCMARRQEISDVILQVLRMRLHFGRLHRVAFGTLNHILLRSAGEDLALGRKLAADLVPLLAYWWQPRTLDNDELLFSVRDEMLNTMHLIHLYLDSLLKDISSASLLGGVEDLLDNLWAEYSQRSHQSRLRLDDLTFSSMDFPSDYFCTGFFALRPFVQDAERRWALVETMAQFEDIFLRHAKNNPQRPHAEGEQPRKRLRVAGGSHRIHQKILSSDSGIKLTALQLTPFFLPRSGASEADLFAIVDDLIPAISDKQGLISSWAMIACASCALHPLANDEANKSKWKQVWQLAVRSISISGTCRAACVLLHAILEAQLVTYHTIADDVSNIVTMADICGPSVLFDSSLVLMQSLTNIRNEMVPSAIQKTSSHVIRWIFSTWKPAETTYASLFAANMDSSDLINLILSCCGLPQATFIEERRIVGGPISQFRKAFQDSIQMIRYLLLLDDGHNPGPRRSRVTNSHSASNLFTDDLTSSSSHTFRTLVLELLFPKLDEFAQIFETATQTSTRRGAEAPFQLSPERLKSLLACLVSATILLPYLQDLESRISTDIKAVLTNLWENSFQLILDSSEIEPLEVLLASLAPYLPILDSASVGQFCNGNPHLFKIYMRLSEIINERDNHLRTGKNPDAMEVDNEFESQASTADLSLRIDVFPRDKIALRMSTSAFAESIKMKLYLLHEYFKEPDKVGLVPDSVVDRLLSLDDEKFLLCGSFLEELIRSDFGNTSNYAAEIIERVGEILKQNNFSTCEVAWCMCMDILTLFAPFWSMGDGDPDLTNPFVDLYNFLVKSAWANNMLSMMALESLSSLLYRLMEINAQFHMDKGAKVESPRSTLFSMLSAACMSIRFRIGPLLTGIFELYVMNEHDSIFVDILSALPSDPDVMEGIAFRIFTLSALGCKWPTLLKRCVYHIVEIPRTIPGSAEYAAHGMKTVARARLLRSPQELFQLFAPQLLYTWLENDSIEAIPYTVFDFSTVDELLAQVQTEAAALMIMRGQEQAVNNLATRLHLTTEKIVRNGFSKITAYAIADDLVQPKDHSSTGEFHIKKILGKEQFYEHIYSNFADVISNFFDLIYQDDPVEKSWRKDESLVYAADIMDEIKRYSHSSTELPFNQQPFHKCKYLTRQIESLVKETNYDMQSLWTPPLVASVARRLLNTTHSALGPQHALSVVRKIRVLICLAGRKATSQYPLEMLLRSLRPFISDTECADDALGMSQWLINNGTSHLAQSPSFLAGYALSTLASLRMFLESSQSSTTMESQFRSTMSKAQNFHTWLIRLLREYESEAFKSDTQAQAFRAITDSASNIRTTGNSEKHTHESRLLLELLKDAEQEDQLLNESARDLALRMLCGDFKASHTNNDMIATDEDARVHGPMVWKSCRSVDSSKEYLTWAGRVVGRSFAASGDIPPDILKESLFSTYRKITTEHGDSGHGILRLLSNLTMIDNSSYAGLAESAIRGIVSHAVASENHDLINDCRMSLPETLYTSSNWSSYWTPPSDSGESRQGLGDVFELEMVESSSWARDLSIYLAKSVEDPILCWLPSILAQVDGFAEKSLPYVVHLCLINELDGQQAVRRSLSTAFKEWMRLPSSDSTNNIKLIVNIILYLRARVFPDETSITDRLRWLDVNSSIVAEAAVRCGMFKVGLMFAEIAFSEPTRSSHRASAREEDPAGLLLEVFENIDDPDAYYGLERTASLSNVLARLEYEKEGGKSLAFRGAQYDSHLRMRDSKSERDGQSLVKILSSLGLAGLSDSLLQTHQHHDGSSASLESTFTTARRLEKWNLPAPLSLESHAATTYRAYQSVYKAVEIDSAKSAIRDGLSTTMSRLVTEGFKASELRKHLGTLASLTELDEVLAAADYNELQRVLSNFETRSRWMMSGKYDDISSILSHRQTTLSMLSQKEVLRTSKVTSPEARLVEIRSLLLSSDIYRFHQAIQEALNVSTTLRDLVAPSEAIGLVVDAAIRIDEANSLWEYGEMISSIRLLQGLHSSAVSLKKQSIPVSHADIMSKIGYQVSVAKLETAANIQKKYLEPALKVLRGTFEGKEAGQVFHQFATFCDEQLQDPEMLKDLARLQRLVQNKSEEVSHYRTEYTRAANSQAKAQFAKHLDTAQKYLNLDRDELNIAQKSRNEFIRLSLENYLQSLSASDDHNNDALRFTALWLERSDNDYANTAVSTHLKNVPSRKFAPLMNQLSSRLQNDKSHFQASLLTLVYRICCDHPYHGMYQIWVGANAKPNAEDEVAILRKEAARRVGNELVQTKGRTPEIWRAIDRTSTYYHELAREKNGQQRSGSKINIKDSRAATALAGCLTKFKIPPPTLEIELSADKDYTNVPITMKLEPTMSVAGGVSAPKILTVVASNGGKYRQLVKGGNDDLRQDAIMEQVFAAVSSLLKQHRTTRQRNLGIRTYKVLPLTARTGIIEFVANTEPLHEWLMPAHERYYPKDLKGSQCRRQITDVQGRTTDIRVLTYRKVTEKFHPVMRYFFLESFPDPEDWYAKRLAYTRTTAAISILGHVLGLGDRHGHNILLDKGTGEVVHIDLGVAFETGRILPIPEVVPFRLTRDIVDGMGVTKTDGVFRRCCEFTLDALREDTYSIMTILDVLRYDPLYSWSSTPMRLAKLQHAARRDEEEGGGGGAGGELENKKKVVNEPSEADRALELVRKKLSKTLSVTATVNALINQATDERNLAVLYSGWAAYA